MEKDYGTVGEKSRDIRKQKAFSDQLSTHGENLFLVPRSSLLAIYLTSIKHKESGAKYPASSIRHPVSGSSPQTR